MKIIPCNKTEFNALAKKADKQFGETWCKPNIIGKDGKIAFIIENGSQKVKLSKEEKLRVVEINRKDKNFYSEI